MNARHSLEMQSENILTQLHLDRETILAIIAKHGATNVRVFGSVARGEARPDSDIDLLVTPTEKTSPWFPASLILDLERTLGRDVDVVTDAAGCRSSQPTDDGQDQATPL
jgi:hypothetical protein